MQILVTGANGRVGNLLVQQLQARGHTVTGIDIDTIDITDRESVNRAFDSTRPDLVIHCAALTAVDYCAQNPDEALNVNGFGTQTVALACQKYTAALLYLSTNEVFDGQTPHPYQEYDQPNPSNPYAYSKWVGEQAVRDLVHQHYIVRTAWIFAHGGKNFIHSILQRAQANDPLRVVINEIGCPTYNNDLVNALCQLITTEHYGIYHLTNAGHTSRYSFARRVLDLTGYTQTEIEPITLSEYNRASRPPAYSVLRNFTAARLGISLCPWEEALAAFLAHENLLHS